MPADTALVGRDAERDRLRAALADAAGGAPQALVIRGDPGIGKTRLLDAAVADAAQAAPGGFRPIRVAAHEAESEIPYAALSLLLGPLLDGLAALPRPQAAALEGALNLGPGGARRPAGRRGGDARAARAGRRGTALAPRRRRRAQPGPSHARGAGLLRAADARRSGSPCWPPPAPPPTPRRRSNAGSPGCRSWSSAGSTSARPAACSGRTHRCPGRPGRPRPATRSPCWSCRRPGRGRCRSSRSGSAPGWCTPTSAASPGCPRPPAGPCCSSRWRAAPTTRSPRRWPSRGWPCPTWSRPRTADLLGQEDRADGQGRAHGSGPRFRHPLIRSAVYHAAAPGRKRAAHRALAAVHGRRAGPGPAERRAFHLAAATPGADEEVAAQVAAAARSAAARNNHVTALALLERAARLSPTGPDRTRRLLEAALTAQTAGSVADATPLLDMALLETDDPELVTAARHLQCRVQMWSGQPTEARDELLHLGGPDPVRRPRPRRRDAQPGRAAEPHDRRPAARPRGGGQRGRRRRRAAAGGGDAGDARARAGAGARRRQRRCPGAARGLRARPRGGGPADDRPAPGRRGEHLRLGGGAGAGAALAGDGRAQHAGGGRRRACCRSC